MFSRFFILTAILMITAGQIYAQKIGSLQLILSDQNGARISEAVIRIKNKDKIIKEFTARHPADYTISGLPAGAYELWVAAEGFTEKAENIDISEGNNFYSIRLSVVEIRADVKISESDLEQALSEAFKKVWTIDEIESLPSTPEEIEKELKRRYGDDVTIRINGFTGGRIPPRDQIASIKVIRSSFDAEFHEVGNSVVDIKTKAGLPKIAGFLYFNMGNSALNARNPFLPAKLPEANQTFAGFLGIPLAKKKTSATVSLMASRNYIQKNIVAYIPGRQTESGAKFHKKSFFPQVSVDHNLSNDHVVHLTYQLQYDNSENLGVGDFNIEESGYSRRVLSQHLRFSGTALVNKRYVNEYRIEIKTNNSKSSSNTATPSVVILNQAVFGGAGITQAGSRQSFSGVDNLLFDRGKHSLKLGAAFDLEKNTLTAADNVNGTFIYTSLENYLHFKPSIFTKRLGESRVNLNQLRLAAYAQDDVRLTQNFTIGFGLRSEIQSNLNDHNNLSPRLSFTYSPSKEGKIVFRSGFGVFYQWLETQNLISIMSNDGRQTSDLIIENPDYAAISQTVSGFSPVAKSVGAKANDLANPYVLVIKTGFNYRLKKNFNLESFYNYRRGVNLFRSRDLNAPLGNIRPDQSYGRIALFESSGNSTENSVEIRADGSFVKGINFNSRYLVSKIIDDFDGLFNLPANSYDLKAEKGFSSLDRRHLLTASISFNLFGKLNLTPVFTLNSPLPYTITTGHDDNGDSVFSDRPSGISRNTQRGEWLKQADLRMRWQVPLSNLMRFKGAGKPGDAKKYSIGMEATVQNIFNSTNLQNFIGNISSPYYRQAINAAPARQIQLGVNFIF